MDAIPGRFDGRTAIVTGAGSGIGRATAQRLVAEGATVIATDISTERLEALSAELGTSVRTVDGDISAQSTTDAIMAAADGRVDHLVNNSGIMDGFLPAAEMTDEVWDQVMAVNVTGVMRLTRAVLPLMVEAGTGTIVNVGSIASVKGSVAGTAYTTSKHALVGFTRSTAFFYTPQGIRCNAVLPGGVATNIEAPFNSEFAQARLGPLMQTNVPGIAQPEELAAAITWLLSDDSANVSGAIVNSDGGWCAI